MGNIGWTCHPHNTVTSQPIKEILVMNMIVVNQIKEKLNEGAERRKDY